MLQSEPLVRYREGLEAGKAETVQAGFNDGFARASVAAFLVGQARHQRASACLLQPDCSSWQSLTVARQNREATIPTHFASQARGVAVTMRTMSASLVGSKLAAANLDSPPQRSSASDAEPACASGGNSSDGTDHPRSQLTPATAANAPVASLSPSHPGVLDIRGSCEGQCSGDGTSPGARPLTQLG